MKLICGFTAFIAWTQANFTLVNCITGLEPMCRTQLTQAELIAFMHT